MLDVKCCVGLVHAFSAFQAKGSSCSMKVQTQHVLNCVPPWSFRDPIAPIQVAIQKKKQYDITNDYSMSAADVLF